MEISEKLKQENGTEIRLYKEGVFWVAYEQSAYAVWLQKKYKPTRKFVKTVSREIVSLGFPDNALKDIHLQLESPVDEMEFQSWKNGIEMQVQTVSPKTGEIITGQIRNDTIEVKIRDFDLSNATPMNCMMFLAELKKGYGALL